METKLKEKDNNQIIVVIIIDNAHIFFVPVPLWNDFIVKTKMKMYVKYLCVFITTKVEKRTEFEIGFENWSAYSRWATRYMGHKRLQ